MAPKILKIIFERYRSLFDQSMIILIIFAAIKLIIPMITHSDFELHRDEFLYLAMADHLSWVI